MHIKTSFAEEWQKDVFDQHLCDLGVDTIDAGSEPEQDSYADYYIPSALWEQNQTAIKEYLSTFSFPFSFSEVPDENWNAVWEAEHPVQELPMGVRIVPHCAFGAGYHETTSMLIEALINRLSAISDQLSDFRVLDNGTGTGVLGIFAKRLGAGTVVAIDIDEKSVANAQENAALNGIEMDVRLGNLSSPPFREGLGVGSFNLILSNIHRNILISQMSVYAHLLRAGGELWMSGFYEADCPALEAAAEAEGLTLRDVLANGEWRMMRCRKEGRR